MNQFLQLKSKRLKVMLLLKVKTLRAQMSRLSIRYVGGGKLPPAGWSGVRSGARLTNVTSTGTQNYVKNATSLQATREFNNLAPGAQVRKYIKADGSTTFVKFSAQGDIRLYKATSTGGTSISWYNQKIRYLD